MPSAQDCADRLREQAYRTLLPQIRDLEEELQNVSGSLSTGIHQIERKLEALRHIELPTAELVLGEILEDVIQQKELEASALVLFARGLRRRETQEEILTFLLDAAKKYFPRVALFAVRGNRFVGWSSRGFSEPLARNLSSCSFLRSECPQFQEALESEVPLTASSLPNNDPLPSVQEEVQGLWQLVPLCAMQHPVALLLAGGTEKDSSRCDDLSVMAEFTVLRLENIALRILYELSAEKPEPVRQPMPAKAAAAPEPLAALEPLPEIPVAGKASEPAQPEAAAADSRFELEPIHEPAQAPAEAATIVAAEPAVPVLGQPGIPVSIQQPEVAKAPQQEAIRVPEEEKLHTDAKRFARLLVSEIKLYNEHHVAEGRENRDLYLRLKRDIDRSREMYEKRVSPTVSRKIDYFHDEVIRILGDNDPSTLGSDYPGPRVES